MRDEASVSGLSLSRGRALLLGIRDVNRLDDLAQRHASGRYGFARIQLLQECFLFLIAVRTAESNALRRLVV